LTALPAWTMADAERERRMTLEQIANGHGEISLVLIGGDDELVEELQLRLSAIGLLDPPADGVFGPVSLWALNEFLRSTGQEGKDRLDRESARLLLSEHAGNVFPLLDSPGTLAGTVCGAIQRAGHWLSHHPDCINIVYVEGTNIDGTPNENLPNEFNDVRLVVRVAESGKPEILGAWEATTEPGRHHTSVEKLHPLGAARIALGQYKSWSIGNHHDHLALVQTAKLRIFRDLNEDFERSGDQVFEGLFGINQHWGYDLPKRDIGRASAGCLVGRAREEHQCFMRMCESDPRYNVSHTYRFLTCVLSGTDMTEPREVT